MPPVSAVGTLPLAPFGACTPGRRFRRSPSHVPCQSRRPGSRRLHAGHHLANHRDARQARHGGTAKSPAFDATLIVLTTPQQRTPTPRTSSRVLSGTSSWSPPDASSTPFPRSLTTTVFSQRSTRWFSALPRRTTLEGQQASISGTAPPMKDVSYMTSSSAFVTHGCRAKVPSDAFNRILRWLRTSSKVVVSRGSCCRRM